MFFSKQRVLNSGFWNGKVQIRQKTSISVKWLNNGNILGPTQKKTIIINSDFLISLNRYANCIFLVTQSWENHSFILRTSLL